MRRHRMWVVYKTIGERYPRRRYFKIHGDGGFSEKLWASSASLYETKEDAETAALLFVTKQPEFIGKLFVTHAIR